MTKAFKAGYESVIKQATSANQTASLRLNSRLPRITELQRGVYSGNPEFAGITPERFSAMSGQSTASPDKPVYEEPRFVYRSEGTPAPASGTVGDVRNNTFNVHTLDPNDPWYGATYDPDAANLRPSEIGEVKFDTLQNGDRAGIRNLMTKVRRGVTPEQLRDQYITETDPAIRRSYAGRIAANTTLDENGRIAYNNANLKGIARAILGGEGTSSDDFDRRMDEAVDAAAESKDWSPVMRAAENMRPLWGEKQEPFFFR